MSEFSSPFEKIRIHLEEKSRDKKARTNATSAMNQFCISDQEPVASYKASAHAELDLNKLGPSAILRIKYLSGQESIYVYYVIGDTVDNNIYMYQAYYSGRKNTDPKISQKPPKWKLNRMNITKTVFSVDNTMESLGISGWMLDVGTIPDQIDLMHVGTKETKGKRVRNLQELKPSFSNQVI